MRRAMPGILFDHQRALQQDRLSMGPRMPNRWVRGPSAKKWKEQKRLGTSASLLVTSALLVVTKKLLETSALLLVTKII